MSLIKISDLTFQYDGSYDPIFTHVSFQIDTDWKLGFTGRNGRGKTTFLKLLQGKLEYTGSISAGVAFDYFPFEVPDKHLSTVTVINSILKDYEPWQLNRELSLLEVSDDVLYRPFETLSSGERTKVLLAALFLQNDHFLLIDEPTNHLDRHAREIVGRYLNSKKGFLLVSHDRSLLDHCIDHILSINKTNIEIQRGNFSSWLVNKESQDNFEITENEKLKKDIRRLEKTAREKAAWSDKAESRKIGFNPSKTEKNIGRRPAEGAKSKKMMKRAKVIEARQQAAIQDKSKLLKNLEDAENLKITSLSYHTNRLVTLDNISVSFGEKTVCRNISFSIEQGDRIALCGKNGCGKSSILKLLMGEKIAYSGNLLIGSGLQISYVPQDTSFLCGNLNEFASENRIDESLFKTILRKLDFSRIQFEKDIRDFSEGQKKKVLIAKSLCEQAHLYIWDEPLNFIDVFSRMQIEELLKKYQPTMLFVEHDSTFTDAVATSCINL